MTIRPVRPRTLILVALSVLALASGCAATPSRSNSAGMMGGDGQYHDASLTCAAPPTLPGSLVSITLADMGMTSMMGGTAPKGAPMRLQVSPATAPAGEISLVAANKGWRTHELVILPLADGAAVGQRIPGPDGRVDEVGSVGEASNSCAADAAEGIRSGTVGWTTVRLPPGRYELVCNLANHYADGMRQELDVS